jgi:Tfp pilus assembly protein PilO
MEIDRPITIAVILFIILLLVFFLVMPEYNTFTELQTELGQKKAEYNAQFDYYAAISKVYFDLQSRQDDIKKIDDALPTNPDLGKVIYYLQNTATENGMLIKDVFLSKSSQGNAQPQGSAGYVMKDIVFSMDLLGDYPSLTRFMITLEQSSRIFEVTNISFGAADQAQAQSSQSQFQIQQTFSFNLQVRTHSY